MIKCTILRDNFDKDDLTDDGDFDTIDITKLEEGDSKHYA